MRLDNKGFGRKELMISLVLIIFFVVVSMMALINNNDEKGFSNFKVLANKFGEQAAIVRDEDVRFSEKLYLTDLFDNKTVLSNEKIYQSPFSRRVCDEYESLAYARDDNNYLTLKCDDYIISDHLKTASTVIINKVGPWLPVVDIDAIEAENIELIDFYTIENDSFNGYYIEREFIDIYNKENLTTYFALYEIEENEKVMTKQFYRTVEFVEEI